MPGRVAKPVEALIETPDGWRLTVYHYPNRERTHPVILVHGMGSNRFDLDFPDPRLSLAQSCHRHGFDVWVLELRGAGNSQPRSRGARWRSAVRPNWTFDDHVFGDIPAFINHIQRATGKQSFHWVGHSLGGVLVYAAIGVHGNKICQSAVTIGSAMNSHAKPGFAKILIRIEDRFLRFLPLLPGKYLSVLCFPAASLLAPFLDNFYYCLDNMDRKTLRTAMRVATENVSIPLFLQLHRWYQENNFSSLDRRVDYHERLKTIRRPWLVIAGSVDGMTPLPDVYYGHDEIGSREKKFMIFGREFGHKSDYGHLDLVLGNNAPREVYPEILSWLTKHDALTARKEGKNVTPLARYGSLRLHRDTHGPGAAGSGSSGSGD